MFFIYKNLTFFYFCKLINEKKKVKKNLYKATKKKYQQFYIKRMLEQNGGRFSVYISGEWA